MDATRTKPTVFVSSTCLDLKQIREDIKEFLDSNYGFDTILSEFESFPIDPCVGILDASFPTCQSAVFQEPTSTECSNLPEVRTRGHWTNHKSVFPFSDLLCVIHLQLCHVVLR